jgi:hypothetical protein
MGVVVTGYNKGYTASFSVLVFVFAFLTVSLLSAGVVFAAGVTVTPATGGTDIFADKAANAASPAYTTLGNISITENATGDFAEDQTGTLILTAPSGWQFNTSAGNLSFMPLPPPFADIKSASISVSSSLINITISTNKHAKYLDILTISRIQVRAIDGAAIPSAVNILRTSGNPGTATITGITNDVTNFGSLSQVVGSPSQVRVETANDGSGTVVPSQSVAVGNSIIVYSISRDQFSSFISNIAATWSLISKTGGVTDSDLVPAGDGKSATFTGHLVGTAKIHATSASLTSVDSGTITVSKLDQTITFGALSGKTYGDVDFGVTATASSGLTVSFTASGSCSMVDATTVHITGAGSCTITASQAGDDNYNAATDVPQTFNIAKATPTITWANPADITYGTALDSTQLDASASVPGTFVYTPTATTVLVAGAGQTLHVDFTPTDSANYNSASKDVSINVAKADPVIIVTPYSVTYDGNAHTAPGTATGVKSESLSGLDLSGTTHTDAGDYTGDAWTFTDVTGNYNDDSGTVDDNIDKADATIKVDGYTGIYDGNSHGASGSATGVKGEDLSASLDLGSSFTDVPGGTAHWTFTGGTNYNDASGDVAIDISKADALVTVTGYTGVYDALAHGATGSATGVGGVDLSGSLNLGSSFTNVPGGTAHWVFTGGTNYLDENGDVAIVISKANAVIVITPYDVTYDGNAHTATGSAKGVLGESLSGLDLTGTTHTNAGTYPTDAWTYTDVTGNYNDASGTVSDSIGKADQTITFAALPGKTYGDVNFDVTATATSGLPVSFSASGDCSVSGNTVTITGAGSCQITASQAGDSNYNAAIDVPQSFTIAQKTLTVTATADNKVYDGTSDAVAHLTVSGKIGADDVTASGTATFADKNVGTGKTVSVTGIALGGADAGNYVLTDTTATTADITARAITVTATTDTKTYDGTTSSSGVPIITSGTLAPGDTATWTQTFDNKNVGTDKILTPSGSVNDGNSGNNYDVAFVTDTTGVIASKVISSPENDVDVNAIAYASASLTVNTTGPTNIFVKSAAEPSSNVGLIGLGKFVNITTSDASVITFPVTIKIFYTDAEVTAAGVDEPTLKIYFFNTTSNAWQVEPTSAVDTVNNVVSAQLNHLSTYGVYGSAPPAPPSPPAPTGGGGGGGVACVANYTLSSPASVDGAAGSSVTVAVTMTATGTCSGSATITAIAPAGWTATSAATGTVSANKPKTVNIIVTIPSDATNGDVVFSAVAGGKTYTSTTTVTIPSAQTPAGPATGPAQTPEQAQPGPTPTGQAVSSTGQVTAQPDYVFIGIGAVIVLILAYFWLKWFRRKKVSNPTEAVARNLPATYL